MNADKTQAIKAELIHFRNSYRDMYRDILSGHIGGNALNPFEYCVLHKDKLSGHHYKGMVEAFETAIKIIEIHEAN